MVVEERVIWIAFHGQAMLTLHIWRNMASKLVQEVVEVVPVKQLVSTAIISPRRGQ